MNNHFLFADTEFMDQPGAVAPSRSSRQPLARVYPISIAMRGPRPASPVSRSTRTPAARVAPAPRVRLPRSASHLLYTSLCSLVVLPAATLALVLAMGPGLL